MNAKELSKLLGVHPNTIYNLIRTEDIKTIKKGRSFEIPEDEVERLKRMYLLKENEVVSKLVMENNKLKDELKRIKETLKTLI